MSDSVVLLLQSFAGILLVIFGGIVKQLFNRLGTLETSTTKRFDKTRERHDNDVKSIYKHHDNRSDSLRKDINALSESLRKEIANQADKTNRILLQLASSGRIE